ncbi:MAG: LysR substrate-binding domain-containing protein [Pseudomonadota bacterium]|nr:LysR substrate-binding domain-containing protein [Pseudomonadota bacterium]
MSGPAMPPFAMLRAFEAAARHRSYSAAGRELNVTHVAVSQQVRRLEDWMGVPLMQREGRGVVLTADGQRLATGLLEGFGTIRETVAAFRASDAVRPLKISLTPSFAMSWLMPRIATFRAENPNIELMLNPSADMVDLRRDSYDLAIRFGDGDWPGVESEPFLPSRFAVVAAAALVAGKAIETAQDLTNLPWLQEVGTDELLLWLAARGVKVEDKHDIVHLPGYMMLSALREGQGVACTARVFVEDDIAAGRLVVLFEDDDPDMRTGYHLVRRPGPMREPLKRFVGWLKRAARADAAMTAEAART